MKELQFSMCYFQRTDCTAHKNGISCNLARHMTLLVKLEDGVSILTSSTQEEKEIDGGCPGRYKRTKNQFGDGHRRRRA